MRDERFNEQDSMRRQEDCQEDAGVSESVTAGQVLPGENRSDAQEVRAEMSFRPSGRISWTARSVLAFVVGVGIVLFLNQDIAGWLQMPLHQAYGSAEVARDNSITIRPWA